MTQIIELVEVPPALKAMVISEINGLEDAINTIVFGAYMDHMGNSVGSFTPKTKTISIDFGNALHESSLYNSGMMFIPSVWFNVMWALNHEVEHALQLEVEPELIEFDKLPQEYEDMAMVAGKERILEWAKNNKVPPLDQLGWLGKQLIVMLNAMYTKRPDIVDEVDYLGIGAAAPIDAVFANWEFSHNGRRVLIDEIDAGKIGVKQGQQRFLTAYEFLGL